MPREALLRKCKLISPRYTRRRNFSNCAPLDCLFSTVYDILASFSDLTDPPVQYSIYVENLTSSSFPGDHLASFRRLKICISFVPSHLTAIDHLIVQKCTHVTTYETDATKILLDLSLAPRERD